MDPAVYARRMLKIRTDGYPLRTWLRLILKYSHQSANGAGRGKGAVLRRKLANELDVDFLIALYHQQNGLCAVSGIKMTTKVCDVCAISIDRVDADLGYLKSNVVLVCRWVNLGRGRHCSLEQFREILNQMK